MYFVPGAKYSEELHEESRAGFAGSFGGSLSRLLLSGPWALSPFSLRLVLDLVNLPVGRGGGVDHAAGPDFERLHLQFLRLENDGRVPVGRDAVDARGRSGRGVNIPCFVGGHGPDVGRWRRVEQFERRRQFQAAGTADGHSCGRALGEVLEFRLLPGARAVGEEADAQTSAMAKERKMTKTKREGLRELCNVIPRFKITRDADWRPSSQRSGRFQVNTQSGAVASWGLRQSVEVRVREGLRRSSERRSSVVVS